jgi:two-component system, OmpR family, copper resistance phosphate regulon response regulator CusR
MKNRKILVVEDEKKIADTLKIGLKENGYAVEVAYDGRQGLSLYEEQPFSLIILDINLPGISGYELCKKVRAGNGRIPIIMLTALSTLDDKVEGYNAGADDYLCKPFQFKELLLKTRVLLKRSMPDAPEPMLLNVGELEMNLDSKEVKRAGKKINLTAKEFQLLEFLMRNKNKVLSRSDIAINVWDINFDTNTNVIDVYINYLRNKVDKMYDTKYIQTQVGMGYVLKENP